MRNLFDQYTQPENRLTHALASALNEDTALLQRFVEWATDRKPPKTLRIVEQRLPGEPELADVEDYQKRGAGLPDAWIHDNDQWSLLIESKVACELSADQLSRHYQTARRRGFGEVQVLALDISPPSEKLPEYVIFRLWSELYRWLVQEQRRSAWAKHVVRYMEVADAKWPQQGYLKEGTLTVFSGIHFDQENPYSYHEGKRLLKLMMAELRNSQRLAEALNIDLDSPGRPAITGKDRDSVWDYLRLRSCDADARHIHQPHLTLAIRQDQLRVMLNVPNGINSQFSRRLKSLGEEEFLGIMQKIASQMESILDSVEGAFPYFHVAQRWFRSQRSAPVTHGEMLVDLRTSSDNNGSTVKYQPQWIQAGYELFCNKRSNIEFAVGAIFPFSEGLAKKGSQILPLIVGSWISCEPLLQAMLPEYESCSE